MIMGSFSPEGWPLIRGVVAIGLLQVQHRITFLVDTGADRTHLHYPDVEDAGVDPRALEEVGVPDTAIGVGGSATYIVTPARVYLTDRDTGFPVAYDIDLYVADASQAASHHHSVLGRDILDQHLMIYDRRTDRIELHRH